MMSTIVRLSKADLVDFIIVEGSMITDLSSVFNLLDHTIFITLKKELCFERRLLRIYDPPDEEGCR